ncbi:MAG: hypothetical protein QM802_21000 [Agriterribacter sp.]
MSVDLIKVIAQKEGISTLPIVDPNTQDISATSEVYADKLAQAAIPSVLTGMYKYSRDVHQADTVLEEGFVDNWETKLFGDNLDVLKEEVANYASVSIEEADIKLREVLSHSLEAIRENVPKEDGAGIKQLFTDQRTNILSHLPAAIRLGNLLNDNSLDDRTNKMQGPVSNLMHSIEKAFSGSQNPEDLEGK